MIHTIIIIQSSMMKKILKERVVAASCTPIPDILLKTLDKKTTIFNVYI